MPPRAAALSARAARGGNKVATNAIRVMIASGAPLRRIVRTLIVRFFFFRVLIGKPRAASAS
jgi:hypothetical protein